MKETIKNVIVTTMYFSPAVLACVLFMVLGFSEIICMFVCAIVVCLTIWATDQSSRS